MSAIKKDVCWICARSDLKLVKASNIKLPLSSVDFKITDSNYGHTGDIYSCNNCGFHQCMTMPDVLEYYENMDDPVYEMTRSQRAIQEKNILDVLKRFDTGDMLLDVGAGSGIMVEVATQAGYQACGVEPSIALQRKAGELGHDVISGTIDSLQQDNKYDVITSIDVLEHVSDPVDFLKKINQFLDKEGLAIIVTPDRKSFFARVLGWRWWHYRIAHIGYFDKQTLKLALGKAGLTPVLFKRPVWYLPANYIFDRLMKYIPKIIRCESPGFLKKIVIPLNLRDSILVVCKKSP
tara:strand:+ start:14208 stop:15086 length:879 start_codon:yes stop_codon:yes gene_type:complete